MQVIRIICEIILIWAVSSHFRLIQILTDKFSKQVYTRFTSWRLPVSEGFYEIFRASIGSIFGHLHPQFVLHHGALSPWARTWIGEIKAVVAQIYGCDRQLGYRHRSESLGLHA